MIELCCEYLSVQCIWLYVVITSRTSFWVNLHSIVCLNVKKLLARSRHHIWSLSDSDETQTHLTSPQSVSYYLVHCLENLEKVAKMQNKYRQLILISAYIYIYMYIIFTCIYVCYIYYYVYKKLGNSKTGKVKLNVFFPKCIKLETGILTSSFERIIVFLK